MVKNILQRLHSTLQAVSFTKSCFTLVVHVAAVVGSCVAQHSLVASSLSQATWQIGATALFCTQQYHSSDLSPFTCRNVRKQDVLCLLSLPGKAGTLIPLPQGAKQYGGVRSQLTS